MSATAFQRMRREKGTKITLESELENVMPLNDYKIAELKEMLVEKSIEFDPKAKKEDLIKLLEGAE